MNLTQFCDYVSLALHHRGAELAREYYAGALDDALRTDSLAAYAALTALARTRYAREARQEYGSTWAAAYDPVAGLEPVIRYGEIAYHHVTLTGRMAITAYPQQHRVELRIEAGPEPVDDLRASSPGRHVATVHVSFPSFPAGQADLHPYAWVEIGKWELIRGREDRLAVVGAIDNATGGWLRRRLLNAGDEDDRATAHEFLAALDAATEPVPAPF